MVTFNRRSPTWATGDVVTAADVERYEQLGYDLANREEGIESIKSYEDLVSGGDWHAAFVQALTDASAGSAQGRVLVPNRGTSYVLSAGLVIPTGVQVIGVGRPGLDFTALGSGEVALTLNERSVAENLWVQGGGSGSGATGLLTNGPHIHPEDLNIADFGTGVDFGAPNSYINTLRKVHVQGCALAIDARLAGPVPNAGERLGAIDSTFSGCTQFLEADDFADLHFTHCSFNHPTGAQGFANITGGARVWYHGGHWETNTGATPAGALMKITGDGHVTWQGVEFILDGAFPVIVDHATESGGGSVTFQGCHAYFQPSDLGGAFALARSETVVYAPSGSTSAVVRTPFMCKQVRGSIAAGFTTNNPAAPGQVPVATYGGGTNSSVLNLSWSPATTQNTETLVRFG